MTPKLAFYARYSCDQQKETSIDDQLRQCRDFAQQHAITTDQAQVFEDQALSGTLKHIDKRTGYQSLLAAWDANEFTVLVVDEFSRLTRDAVEQAQLVRRLENNRRVRLLTVNGIDTNVPNWQLQVGLAGLVGQQSTRDTQHRVGRGMVGQLERGYLIAAPAYGYDYQRDIDSRGNSLGTRWVIDEKEATVVREIFARREAGESMHQIAAWLNATGVSCSRKAKSLQGGFWRPARIRDLLTNTIYRGEFRWHGSKTYHDKAAKLGIAIEERIFLRPELRLVSDETWQRCNDMTGTRTGYGGGKNALAGIVTCGCCGGTLAVSASKRVPSLFCPSCTLAKHMDAQTERMSSTIATAGVQYLLTEALKQFLAPASLDAFKAELRKRLTGDNTQALEATRVELLRLTRSQERLSHRIAADETEDEVLMTRYAEARASVQKTQARLVELEAGRSRIDPDVVEAQLQVDPAEKLACLFEQDLPPHRLRMVLGRMFPAIIFDGKERRYTAVFTLRFAPGAALAQATGTETLAGGEVEMRFRLSYSSRSHLDPDEPRWTATRLEVHTADAAASPVAVRSTAIQPVACAA